MNLVEFDTRYAKVYLTNFVKGEFDIPIPVAIVEDSGRAIVDLHTVRSPAPTSADEPVLLKSCYPPLHWLWIHLGPSRNSQKLRLSLRSRLPPQSWRRESRNEDHQVQSEEKQILDLDGITPAYGHTTANSIRHFQRVRAERPCNCTTYLATAFPFKTFMVMWDYQDLEILGGAPPAGLVIIHTLATDMALLYLTKFGDQPPVPVRPCMVWPPSIQHWKRPTIKLSESLPPCKLNSENCPAMPI